VGTQPFGSPPSLPPSGDTLRPIPDDEAAQREAEHKAAALPNLGWETGAGATIWARAIRDVLALHESARQRYAADHRRS
jgi:hypothetical protein